MSTIPVFIITFERLDCLRKTVNSIRRNAGVNIQIIFSDNGTTHEPTRQYIRTQVTHSKAKVYWNPTNDPFANVRRNLRDYLATHKRVRHFVVTDPDTPLDDCKRRNTFVAWRNILDEKPGIKVVGAMLRINDIEPTYALRDKVYERHQHIWKLPRRRIRGVPCVQFPIDSSIGMYRASEGFQRQRGLGKPTRPGIRTLAPYTASHLDWYLDLDDVTPDHKVYQDRCRANISHWSKKKK